MNPHEIVEKFENSRNLQIGQLRILQIELAIERVKRNPDEIRLEWIGLQISNIMTQLGIVV